MKHETPDILQRIVAVKQQELLQRQRSRPLAELRAAVSDCPPPRAFAAALEQRLCSGEPAVIAEIKKASPSKGVLRHHFEPVAIAASYQRAGATCISVLTDEQFFHGSDACLQAVRAHCQLPVLRKDFTIDAYQVYEARFLGADCILLIAAILTDAQLTELSALARDIGLDALVEVHDEHELERVLPRGPALIGINNRDLRTFNTDLNVTLRLRPRIPEATLVVTESGILSTADVALMRNNGVHAFLVGEAFMREPDPGSALRTLFSLPPAP